MAEGEDCDAREDQLLEHWQRRDQLALGRCAVQHAGHIGEQQQGGGGTIKSTAARPHCKRLGNAQTSPKFDNGRAQYLSLDITIRSHSPTHPALH